MFKPIRVAQLMLRDESGASMVEYAIVAAALVLPLVAIFAALETNAGNILTTTGTNLTAIGQNV